MPDTTRIYYIDTWVLSQNLPYYQPETLTSFTEVLEIDIVKRSERTSQSFTSVCYEVWVSEVNVHDFFESKSTSTVNTDFFWYEGTSTVDIDRFIFGMNPYRRSISTDFGVKSTVDQISTVFSSM